VLAQCDITNKTLLPINSVTSLLDQFLSGKFCGGDELDAQTSISVY